MAMANHAFADSITDGLGMAGDTFYSYTPYVQTLGFVLACIIGIAGAFAIYYAIANNDRNVKKRILAWGGSCIAMLCMTIALPKFFFLPGVRTACRRQRCYGRQQWPVCWWRPLGNH